MHHVAIMKKEWGMIPKILSSEKTVESRWYKSRFAPWDKIKAGDTVYFKNSGEPVTTFSTVTKVIQFNNLNEDTFNEIIHKYGDQIGLLERDYNKYYQSKKYCILIFLKNPKEVKEPFQIDKTGFGISSAWMCIENINSIIQKK